MLLGLNELKDLSEKRQAPCVSMFMPTYKAGKRVEQNPVRFKNLLQKARRRLSGYGLSSREVERLMKPAVHLLRRSRFWRYQDEGLVAFLDWNKFRYYCLPIHFKELLVISTSFHTKPLLPIFASNSHFYILTISLKRIRLFQCTRYSIDEVELQNVPQDFSDILGDKFSQKQLQFHTGAPRRTGGRDARFFGTGGHDQDIKKAIFRYFNQVDKSLRKNIKDEQIPLVLAGVDYLLPIFKKAAKYPNIVEKRITGNPDRLTADELHEWAWVIMRTYFQEAQLDAIASYHALAGRGSHLAANKLEEVAIAAADGRVQTLFVSVGIQHWGKYDNKLNRIRLHKKFVYGDRDILDLAATHSILKGGTVYALALDQMPDNAEVAAVLRY